MNPPLRVLVVEDSEDDAGLVLREIRRGGYTVESERVETCSDMKKALTRLPWDIIICDNSLPQFSAMEAIKLLKESGLDIPLIIVSGTIGEDAAVAALKAGAHDFFVKGKFARLVPAIQRELKDAKARHEHRQAKEALRESERRFRALIESGLDEIIVFDSALKPIYMSPSVTRASEYSWEELSETDPFTSVHPDDQPAARELYEWLLRNPAQPQAYQFRLIRKDGSQRWTEGVAVNLLEDPSVNGIVINYRDITERKQAEQALQEKERLLSEAQRIGRVGSWNYDINSNTLQFSDEMYRLFGLSPNEFHNNIVGFLDPCFSVDRPMVAAWMNDIQAGKSVTELDFRILHKNGELRYLQAKGAVEFDSSGKPARFIGMAQDITEHKLAEIQIYQQIQRLNALRKIDQAITSNSSLRLVLNTLLSEVSAQLQVDAADVLIFDPQEQILQYVAGRGFRTREIESARVHLGQGYAGRVAKERRLIQIRNLKDQPDDPPFTSYLNAEDFVCYFGIPLITKGKVKGVLEVFHRTPLQPYPDWFDFLNTLAGQAAIAIENANLLENLQQSNYELAQAYDATIEGWSRALDLRDKETEGHTQRVTALTIKLASEFHFTQEEMLHIRWGSLLHDIGKMGVPDRILLKSEPLTEEEQMIMQRHPQYAYDLLKPIVFLQASLEIPYYHHEKWDGTGYPNGLKGEEIPIAARLFAVVDVWDALTSDRPYRSGWSEEEALAYILEQSGRHFDPQVVALFFKMIS